MLGCNDYFLIGNEYENVYYLVSFYIHINVKTVKAVKKHRKLDIIIIIFVGTYILVK